MRLTVNQLIAIADVSGAVACPVTCAGAMHGEVSCPRTPVYLFMVPPLMEGEAPRIIATCRRCRPDPLEDSMRLEILNLQFGIRDRATWKAWLAARKAAARGDGR